MTALEKLTPVESLYLETVSKLLANQSIQKALEQTKDNHPWRMATQIELAEISSPTFKEVNRATRFKQYFEQFGLSDVRMDSVGNVIGVYKGCGDGPKLAIVAHMDTVFKDGTNLKVTEDENGVLHGPGICDNAGGMACELQMIRSMKENGIKPIGDIIFVGSVGEEGNGALKGCRTFIQENPDFDGFYGIDGSDVSALYQGAVGSKRFRITFNGPGGHSLFDYGKIASATHALCRAGAKLASLKAPSEPLTTYTIGVISGGTSVNAIAASAQMELDFRSVSQEMIDQLSQKALAYIDEAVEEENKHWEVSGAVAVSVVKTVIGERPAGQCKDSSPALQGARAAMAGLGIELKKYMYASKDHNIPLSLGYPATTIGCGGTQHRIHSLEESFDPTDAYLGPQLGILATLTLVGLDGVSEPMLPRKV